MGKISNNGGVPLKPAWKVGMIGAGVLLVLVIGAAVLAKLRGATDKEETAMGDLLHSTYTEQDYQTKGKSLEVSPKNPSASAYGVTIDFGEFGLDAEEKLEIKKLSEKTDETSGVKVTAYDFNIMDKSDFEDVITITLPYDQAYAEEGLEKECIGAKYYNQSTLEWEAVYYEVDVVERQVRIYTTHLSTYGVFQVKNENTRKAYITDVYAIASLMNSDKSFAIIKELAEQGKPGSVAFEAGFEAINYVVGNTGNAVTAVTLGGQYEGALAGALGKGTQHLGLALAAVQTCYDFAYKFSDDQDKLRTLSNLVKNLANNGVGYFGSSALQVGFAGISVFDMILSTVQSDMVELKLENIGDVYQYYNDVEAPRSTKEWRHLFIDILQANSNNPQKAQQMITQEIDRFCDRFWKLGYGKVKEIAGVAGKKYSFDEREWTKDREVLTEQYRAYLMYRLQAPLTSARKFLLTQAQEQAQQELEKQLRALQRELNKTVKVQIIEQPEKEGEYKYGGYTVRFAPLSSSTDVKNWSGRMPESGELNTSFTVLGHMQSGAPNQVEIYPPGKDTPELTVSFKVAYPLTTIYLTSKAEEEKKKPEKKEEATPTEQPDNSEMEKEYAWVLTETNTNDWQERLAAENKSKEGSWRGEVAASPGSATFTVTYTGNTDGSMVNGMTETGEATWNAPSNAAIKPGEEFSMQLGIRHLSNTRKYPQGGWSILAQILRLDEEGNQSGGATALADKDGVSSFTSGAGNNFQAFDAIVYGTFGEGTQEGEEIAIRVYASGAYTSVQTTYIYEWKQVGAASSLDTTGIIGIVDIP